MKKEDLDLLLAEYRKAQPSAEQTQKWKSAVHREVLSGSVNPRAVDLAARRSSHKMWMQLAAASIVGFIVGGLMFGQFFAENDPGNATFEYVLTKR